eukprot:13555531-Heterocapsa_arctica.AAC.1
MESLKLHELQPGQHPDLHVARAEPSHDGLSVAGDGGKPISMPWVPDLHLVLGEGKQPLEAV